MAEYGVRGEREAGVNVDEVGEVRGESSHCYIERQIQWQLCADTYGGVDGDGASAVFLCTNIPAIIASQE